LLPLLAHDVARAQDDHVVPARIVQQDSINAWTRSAPLQGAELLHVLTLPDFERADRIGEFWGYPESRAFAELLIDCEEDRVLRAVLVGMLREAERGR
jgi:hypothetical protein